MADPRQSLGRLGEQVASAHLERLGYEILARNLRSSGGEIDVVARDGSTLVFVEVKARRASLQTRHAWDSLHDRKRRRVRRAAAAYLLERPGVESFAELRFDAIGVVFDGRDRLVSLDHLEAAF